MQILGQSPLSSYKTTLKQQLNDEKWYSKLNHLPVFVLFSAWKNKYKKSYETGMYLSLIFLRWPCTVDRMLKFSC